MRVALFTDTYLPDVNGVSKTLARWVRYLESKNVPVKIFAPNPQQRDVEMHRDVVQRLYSIPFLLYPEVRLGIPNPIQIKKTLRAFRPTIVHVATPFNIGLYGHRYARKHQIPLVASYHTHFDQYLAYYKIQWLEGILWKYMNWFHQDCEKVYVPSPSTLDHLETKGFPRSQMEVWGRGVDLGQFSPNVDRAGVMARYGFNADKFLVLYVGRLAPEKNLDVFLDVYKRLSASHPDRFQFAIAGDGPLYEELVAEYPRESHPDLSFLGFIQGKELGELYAAADTMLFPSPTETFGNVVLESMASGTPVIGAAAGGVKDNIRHGQTGLLCEPGDTDAFEDALMRVYREDNFRNLLSQSAREYAVQQSWDRIFANLLASYQEVAEHQKQNSLLTYSV